MTQPELDFTNAYFNTTNEKGDTLKKYKEIAGEQERMILYWFQKYKTLSPSEIQLPSLCPLTSIRRAISNLTAAGYIRKTDKKNKGRYNRDEYIWELVDKQ